MELTLTADNSFKFWNIFTIFSPESLGILGHVYTFYFLEYVENLAHCDGIYSSGSKLRLGTKKNLVCPPKIFLEKRNIN